MKPPITITLEDRRVRIAGADTAGGESVRDFGVSSWRMPPTELATAVVETLGAEAQPAAPARLVLSAAFCYVQRVRVPHRRPSSAMLAYALEEFLPLDVERMTCDFLPLANGDHLGLAVETEHLQPLLAALAEHGVAIETITLNEFEAIANDSGSPSSSGTRAWCDHGHVTLLAHERGRLTEGRVVRLTDDLDHAAWVERVAGALSGRDALRIAGCAPREWLADLGRRVNGSVESFGEATGASRSVHPLLNLARGALAASDARLNRWKLGRVVAAAGLAALLMISAALFVQRARLEQDRDAAERWEANLAARVLPGQSVAGSVALRLASERRRLEGTTQAGQPAGLDPMDALATLRSLVAALPDDLRLDLREVRIEGHDLTLRGRTTDHTQAERLTAALRSIPSLQCDAPRTDRERDGGVQFVLSGRRDPATIRPNRATGASDSPGAVPATTGPGKPLNKGAPP